MNKETPQQIQLDLSVTVNMPHCLRVMEETIELLYGVDMKATVHKQYVQLFYPNDAPRMFLSIDEFLRRYREDTFLLAKFMMEGDKIP